MSSRYRQLKTDFPIETLNLIMETYFRALSIIDDDENIRIFNYNGWTGYGNQATVKLEITLEKVNRKGRMVHKKING